jgi:hypothetical protein
MLLCNDLNKHRLGNALFKIAFIKATSIRFKQDYALPVWSYSKYFCMENKWSDIKWLSTVKVQEPSFDYAPVENKYHSINVDYLGYWQSFKYFAEEWDAIKDEFRWEKSFLAGMWERTDFRPSKGDWAVHVRLTDYRENPNYIQIPSSYYIEFFNTNDEFYIFSDDIKEAKNKLGTWTNVTYVEGSTDIEDMALMSQFQNIIIANSSFSWWAAHLASLYHKVNVIRPGGLFSGELAKKATGNDFYKPEWVIKPIHNIKIVKNEKVDLRDVTFITVVKIDSQDRRENLHLMIEFLLKHYDTNIIVGENSTHECEWVTTIPGVSYVYFDDFEFHRTKFLNELFRMSETEIVVNHDVDVLIPPSQMEEAVKMIRAGYDFIYPYGGAFLRLPRRCYAEIKQSLSLDGMEGKELQGAKDKSVGGCVLARKSSHFRVGGENEKYMKFGREDVSRHHRYINFGKCGRVEGPLFHIEHFIGPDSSFNHDFAAVNLSEARKELRMTKEQLWSYIQSWSQTTK